jgi:hypothetical protein
MKLTLSNIISIIIIAGLLVLLCVQGCSNLSLKQDLKKEKDERAIITGLWQRLISTPPKITTVIKTVVVKGDRIIVPVPIPNDTTSQEPDTNKQCPRHTYQETYSIGDSIHTTWYAVTAGTINQFAIKEVKYPQRTTTVERYIPPMPVDTAGILKMKIRSFHWGFYAGGFGNDLKTMPSPNLGLFLSFKDKWGLQPGIIYNVPLNKPAVALNVLFYFR